MNISLTNILFASLFILSIVLIHDHRSVLDELSTWNKTSTISFSVARDSSSNGNSTVSVVNIKNLPSEYFKVLLGALENEGYTIGLDIDGQKMLLECLVIVESTGFMDKDKTKISCSDKQTGIGSSKQSVLNDAPNYMEDIMEALQSSTSEFRDIL